MNKYLKISIVGNSGAGKSTIAKKIGKQLGLEVFTIDKIYWLPGWKLRDQDSYSSLHNVWLSKDTWIIDGVGYWEQLETRLNQSDLVIFYDVPVSLCQERAEKRIEEEKLKPNQDIVDGCRYQNVRDLQMSIIEKFDIETKPKIMDLLGSLWEKKVQIAYSGDCGHRFRPKAVTRSA